MKNYIFSSLFFILLFFIACTDNSKSNPPITNAGYSDSSKNKQMSFEKRMYGIDSAIYQLQKENKDSLLTDQFGNKASLFYTIKSYDSAILYGRKRLLAAIHTSDTLSMAKSFDQLGLYHYKKSDFYEAFKNYNQSKSFYLSLGDSSQVGIELVNMAVIQKKTGDFLGSETTATQALGFLHTPKDNTSKMILYHNLSVTSKEQKNYNEALYWNKKALDIVSDTLLRIKFENTRAVVLIKQKKYQKAIETLLEIYPLAVLQHPKNSATKVRILDNLAYAKSKQNKPDAEKELLEALKMREQQNDLSGQFASLIHLCDFYTDRNQPKKALQYAKRAYLIAKQIHGAEAQLEALSYLLTLLDDPKSEIITYLKLNDSITTARQRAKNQFAKIKYDTENTREENLVLKAKNAEEALKLAKEKFNQKMLILISSILIIGILFIIYHWRQRIKTARIKERQSTQNQLSKKLHDEVGNDLYYLLLQLQKISGFTSDIKNIKILQGFDSVYHKIRDFSRDHKIETGDEYGDELITLLNSYGDSMTKMVTSELAHDFWFDVVPFKKEELYWVLKELLTNMKRHSQASLVAVTFIKEKKKIIVTYIDNGIGINLEEEFSKNGLLNVENRMNDINGTITFDSKPKEGFKASIVFTP